MSATDTSGAHGPQTIGSRLGQLGRWLGPWLGLVLVVLSGAAHLGLWLLAVGQETRAAPAEEFGPTAALLAAAPTLRLVRWAAGLSGALALGLWGVVVVRRGLPPWPDPTGRAFERFDQRLAGALAWVVGAPAAGLLVVVLLELAFFTVPRAAGPFGASTLLAYGAVVSLGAVGAGLRLGVELALLLGLFGTLMQPRTGRQEAQGQRTGRLLRVALLSAGAFTSVLSSTLPWALIGGVTALFVVLDHVLPPARRLLALPAIVLLAVWGRAADVTFGVLGDEVRALGLGWLVVALFGLVATLVAAWTWAGVRAQLTGPVEDLRTWVNVIAVSMLSPLTPWVPARGRRAVALLGAAALTWLLASLTYPAFTDFSQVLQKVWSTLLSLLAVGTAVLLASGGARGRRMRRAAALSVVEAALIVVAAALGVAGLMSAVSGNSVRAIAAEYARLGQPPLRWARLWPPPAWPRVAPVQPTREPTLPTDLAQRLPSGRRPPIVVVLWDAARADHLGVYGYERPTTPNLDALARESVVFDHAWSSATATSASLRHLFTGKHSSRYMLAQDHAPFFTGALVSAGYERALVNILGSDYNGVSEQAFVRNQADPRVVEATRFFHTYHEEPKVGRILELVDEYLGERQGEAHPADGLFVFAHFPAPHYPWRNYEGLPAFGERLADRYDSCIAQADRWTGHLLHGLAARGVMNDAIVVVTADHGTGLGEHGRFGGFHPYEEQVHVPLVVRVPGVAPRRVAEPVVGIDLAPTLLALVRPGAPNPFDGLALTPLMSGRLSALDRRYLYSHSAFEDALAVWDIRQGDKLVLHRAERYALLFNLASDPAERAPQGDEHRQDALLKVALGYLEAGRGAWGRPYHYSPEEAP